MFFKMYQFCFIYIVFFISIEPVEYYYSQKALRRQCQRTAIICSLSLASATALIYQSKKHPNYKFLEVIAIGLGIPIGLSIKNSIFMSLHTTKSKKVTFEDVAGLKEAKEELGIFATYLNDEEKFKKMGASVPQGIVLYGPPGNGKTLLARALAAETDVCFFSAAASEFCNIYVGAGASNIRNLFKQAREHGPAIIFIDELDAIGDRNNGLMNGGGSERNSTINQLLAEMNGFCQNQKPILFIGATNNINRIDDALIRSGRFGNHIECKNPTKDERLEILKIHAKNKKMHDDVKLEEIAEACDGFSGANLEQILNNAAIETVKTNQHAITMHTIMNKIAKLKTQLKNIEKKHVDSLAECNKEETMIKMLMENMFPNATSHPQEK